MRKGGELLQSQDTSRILYRTIQVRSTREERGERGEEFNPSPSGSIFNEEFHSIRFFRNSIRF